MRLFMGLAAGIGLLAGNVQATELRPEGGHGGNPYRATCPAGAYVVGVAGYTGDWVDRMQLICAPMVEGVLGSPKALPQIIGNSAGGAPNVAQCAAGSAVYRVRSEFTRPQSETGFVDSLQLQCRDAQTFVQNPGPAYSPALNSGGTSQGFVFNAHADQICPEGELVVGLHGTAGRYIDSIGLICGGISAQSSPGIAMGRARNATSRALGGAAGRTVGAADNTRAAAQPHIGTQALQRQVDCGQPNSAVSQVGGNLPGAAPRTGTDASPVTPFTRRRPNNPMLPGASASTVPPESSATNVGVSAANQSARPVDAPCAIGTAAAAAPAPAPAPAPASSSEPPPPGAQPPVRPSPGAIPPKPQVPRGRLSRDIHPGEQR